MKTQKLLYGKDLEVVANSIANNPSIIESIEKESDSEDRFRFLEKEIKNSYLKSKPYGAVTHFSSVVALILHQEYGVRFFLADKPKVELGLLNKRKDVAELMYDTFGDLVVEEDSFLSFKNYRPEAKWPRKPAWELI